MIIGGDWGGAHTKLCTPQLIESFPSDIVPYREINVENDLRKHDFIFEYNGRRGFAGTLAQDERTALDSNRRGDSKFHEDALIRLLIALHQYAPNRVKVVVGQPITRHKAEKQKIKDMLIGSHTITVNKVRKTIVIVDAAVGAEGASAFYSAPKRGTVHLIDVGSGTINFATMKDYRFINSQSDTISRGLENVAYDPEAIAHAIQNKTIDLGWGNEPTYLLGGGAELLEPFLDYKLFYPLYYDEPYPPGMANAIGFYRVGEMLWGRK